MSDPRPTTWRSGPTPVCATEAMIEAGVRYLRGEWESDLTLHQVVSRILNAALAVAPRPIEDDPEVGDRTDG